MKKNPHYEICYKCSEKWNVSPYHEALKGKYECPHCRRKAEKKPLR